MSATIKITNTHSRMAFAITFPDKLKITLSTTHWRSTCSLTAPAGYPAVSRDTLKTIHAAFERRLQAGPTYGDAIKQLETDIAGVTSIDDLAQRITAKAA